ncbi:hypothetical protein AOX56_22085 [Aeromonas sobria]|uniref:MobD n=1 Tax=Aeromonas sobria TaxID=646 RepID=A0A2H4ZHS2_AERSO|nr:MbeD family mobilization/exclusion protein [Aeromonas sobria]AUF80779.1 mobD [Aeromonas sobria]PKQ72257.1 hypothetical protein AOX56_22085 [Aeromonas sobria]
MTELEQHLLSALEALQSERDQQQRAWHEAYTALQGMFEATQQTNSGLRQEVLDLSEQVTSLAGQVTSLAEQVSRLKK